MPTYDYKCDACGHAFEQFQSMSSEPIRKCPKCRKLKVKRLIGTGAGLIFKGSGFYITDYRDQSYTDKAKAESGSTSGGGNNGEASKSDSGGGSGSGDGTAKPAAETKSAAAESKPSASSSEAASSSSAKAAPKSKPSKKGK